MNILTMLAVLPNMLWGMGMINSLIFIVAIGFLMRSIRSNNINGRAGQFVIWVSIAFVNLMVALGIIFSA